MSLVSMYTESGFRLKRLPKAVISFATFSARCWGVCLLLAWHKNKTAYPHLPQPEHPVFHDARSQYAVSDWPVSPNRPYMQPVSSVQSPSGDWLHSTGQPPVPFSRSTSKPNLNLPLQPLLNWTNCLLRKYQVPFLLPKPMLPTQRDKADTDRINKIFS